MLDRLRAVPAVLLARLRALRERLAERVPYPLGGPRALDAEHLSWFGAGLAVAAAGCVGYLLVLGPVLAARAAPPPPRPTPSPLRVHVAGEVALPGPYDLSPTARIEDALHAAGGATDHADVSAMNQAARLIDGQRVFVPRVRASFNDGNNGSNGSPSPIRTPWPTRTALPTHTPWPTRTPYPTRTPGGTLTPWPTRTPYPPRPPGGTVTAWPTRTPYPTRPPGGTLTPRPTRTPTLLSAPRTAVPRGTPRTDA